MSTTSDSDGPIARRPESVPGVPAAGLLYVTVSLMCFTAVASVAGSYWFALRVLKPPPPPPHGPGRPGVVAERIPPDQAPTAEHLERLERRLDVLSAKLDELTQGRDNAATARSPAAPPAE